MMTRDQFRTAVFARDNQRCVMCGDAGIDAHHIMERRLFDDGGYYLDNGATLCAKHHILAEQTILTCEEIREAAGIKSVVLPSHFYPDDRMDKWGNVYLPNGQRMRGELFYDESVQKILASVLSEFTSRVKYPRTWHLPWSPGCTSDDRVLPNVSHFWSRDVVVTTKMDGECTTMYSDFLHARSLDSRNHPSRNWVKNLQAQIGWCIPDGWRICGENLFAKHSIKYSNLLSYFYVFSIWNEKNIALPWDATVEWCALLGLQHVPVIWRGLFNEAKVIGCYQRGQEGYVVRASNEFRFSDFRKSVAKYVRLNHVTTHGHWMRSTIERNELACHAEN